MDHAVFVRGLECVRELPRDGERLTDRHRALLDALRKIFAGNQFHRQEAHAVRRLP